jgi:hypothetical protein
MSDPTPEEIEARQRLADVFTTTQMQLRDAVNQVGGATEDNMAELYGPWLISLTQRVDAIAEHLGVVVDKSWG